MYLSQVIEFKRGDTIALNFKFTDCENEPINLSNCIARLQIRFVKTNTLTISTTSNDMLTISPDLGEILMTIPPNFTKTFNIGRHAFDLEVTFYEGTVISSETKYIDIITDITI